MFFLLCFTIDALNIRRVATPGARHVYIHSSVVCYCIQISISLDAWILQYYHQDVNVMWYHSCMDTRIEHARQFRERSGSDNNAFFTSREVFSGHCFCFGRGAESFCKAKDLIVIDYFINKSRILIESRGTRRSGEYSPSRRSQILPGQQDCCHQGGSFGDG